MSSRPASRTQPPDPTRTPVPQQPPCGHLSRKITAAGPAQVSQRAPGPEPDHGRTFRWQRVTHASGMARTRSACARAMAAPPASRPYAPYPEAWTPTLRPSPRLVGCVCQRQQLAACPQGRRHRVWPTFSVGSASSGHGSTPVLGGGIAAAATRRRSPNAPTAG